MDVIDLIIKSKKLKKYGYKIEHPKRIKRIKDFYFIKYYKQILNRIDDKNLLLYKINAIITNLLHSLIKK